MAVDERDPDPVPLEDSVLRQPVGERAVVHVAAHGRHRGDRLDLGQSFGGRDVACVEDLVDPGEGRVERRKHPVVSVAYDPDPHATA